MGERGQNMKHFFYDLEVAESLIISNLNKELAKLKLNTQKLLILVDLEEQEKKGVESESVTVPLVAERLRVEEEFIQPWVEELEEGEWIMSIEDPIDRRFKKLFLTNKARSIIDYLVDLYEYSYKKMFRDIPLEDQETFIRVLSQMINNLK